MQKKKTSVTKIILISFLLIVLGIFSLILFLFSSHQPALEVKLTIKSYIVEKPNVIHSIIRNFGDSFEFSEYYYEILGWKDNHTLVYHKRWMADFYGQTEILNNRKWESPLEY